MIARRTFLCGMALETMCVPLAAGAQQSGKIATIGVLRPGSPPDTGVEALLRGLLELGYVEGQNIAIELRYAEGKSGRLAAWPLSWSSAAWTSSWQWVERPWPWPPSVRPREYRS